MHFAHIAVMYGRENWSLAPTWRTQIKERENKRWENNELSYKKQQDGASYTVKSVKICSVHPVFVIKSNRMGQSLHKTVVGSIYQTPAVKPEQQKPHDSPTFRSKDNTKIDL